MVWDEMNQWMIGGMDHGYWLLHLLYIYLGWGMFRGKAGKMVNGQWSMVIWVPTV